MSANSASNLRFWVFSYNRAEFLARCIDSLERCAPQCVVSILDDNSDDPDTRRLLESLSAVHEVVYPVPAPGNPGKHGGLYANMQTAFERSTPDELICFLQDDMQLVREIGTDEIRALDDWLESAAAGALVQPAFLKGANREKDGPATRFEAAAGGYYINRFKNSAGAFYSDILVAKVKKLRAAGWRFLPRESANEQQAREKLDQMLYLKNPFAAWLPLVPAYRGKTRTLALRLAHRLGGCGFHPIRYMTPEEAEAFVNRDARRLPYAEDYLSCDGSTPPEPWTYHPLQGRRLLKLLNSAELKLRAALTK